MKIINFEGLDKSGKRTQSELLKTFLEEEGYKVAKSEFHRYDTPTGELIRKWLYGEYDVSQETVEFIMAADKQAQQKWFEKLEEEGYDYLILDRYILSQKVYGMYEASKKTKTEYIKYSNFLSNLSMFMKEPDYVLYLDIEPKESMARKGEHGENDRYESNLDMLEYVKKSYEENLFFDVFSSYNNFRVNGFQPVEAMAKEIRLLFSEKIKEG